MSADQELRQQRHALAQAVNGRNLASVKAFIHPSCIGRTRNGQSLGYQDIVRLAEQLLAPGSDFEERVEVEDVAVSGDTARVIVRRSHEMTSCRGTKHRGTARDVETWWKISGRWQLVEGQEL